MKRNQIIKSIVLVLILIFLGSNVIQPTNSSLKISTVEKATVKKIDLDEMSKKNNQDVKRFLSLVPEEYQDIVYYKHNDTMQASEIVIVKFKDRAQGQQFQEMMQKHKDERKSVFEGYAPKEAQLLKNSICTIHANYGLFVVDENAKKINNQFLSNF